MKRRQLLALLLTFVMLLCCVSCGAPQDRADALQQAVQPSESAVESFSPEQGEGVVPTDEPGQPSQQATAKPGNPSAPQQTGGQQTAKPVQTQPPAATQKPTESKIKVKVSVDCKTAVAQNEAIRDKFGSGSMVSKTVELDPGASVYDALKKATGSIGVSGGYVYNIGGLSEGDCGGGSGWMYSVNGIYVQKSCKQQKLSDGDVVKWRYTCNNGKDLGASV